MKKISFILILFCNTFFAQYNYNVKYYNSNNGFINSCVHGITHDTNGNIFFSTELGISKFDGKKFENKSFTDGLKENIITLTKNVNGKLWYLAFKKGLYVFKNNKSYRPSKEPILCQNFFVHQNHLLATFVDGIQIYLLDHNQNVTKKIFEFNKNGAPVNIHKFGNEYFYLTTKTLFAIHAQTFKVRTIINSSSSFYLSDAKANILYIAREGEILKYDMSTDKFLAPIQNSLIYRVGAIFIDKDTGIWIGSVNKNNVFLIKNNQFYPMNYIFKSSASAITNFYQDFQSNMWISTYGSGVIKLTQKKLHKIGYETGLKADYITSLDKNQNNLFIATNDGAYRYNYTDKNVYPLFGVNDASDYSFVFSVKSLGSNNLLINTSENLNELIEDNVKNPNIYLSKYRSCVQINDSVIALTGWGAIFGFVNTHTKKIFAEHSDTLLKPTTRTHSLKLLKPGTLLCASDEGLFTVNYSNDYQIKNIKNITSIPHTRINDVFVYEKNIYVGGLGVFAKLDENFKAQFVNEISGTKIEEVKSFALSKKDNLLFIASLNGLFKIDLKNSIESKILLDNDITSQEINCLLFDESYNQLIAGTCSGVDIYDSTLFNPNLNNYLKTPLLINCKVNKDTLYELNNNYINLNSKQDVVNFEVSIPDFENSKILKFRYEYMGDETKTVISENGNFTLSNIPYGLSELRIYSTFDSRIFSKPLIIKINKQSPWFYTAWGMFLIVTITLVLFVLILIISVKQYKKHEFNKLTAQAKLNKLTLMAYNRTMSPHFVFNVLSNIQGLINTDKIELANDYLVGFSKLLRKSIDIIQKEKINLKEEIDFLNKYISLEKMRFSDAITINFVNSIDDLLCIRLMIPPMLIQPLIENSFKYGFGNSLNGAVIEIKCSIENDFLIIIVQDNGQGIKQSINTIASGSFGIRSIKQRLQNYEGSSFVIANVENGRGVINRISIPVKEILDNI